MKERQELRLLSPELDQAREMLVGFLGDRTVLRRLSYRRQQIDYAWPTLCLISEAGELRRTAEGAYLGFEDGKDDGTTEIEMTDDRKGFLLTAQRYRTERMTGTDLDRKEKLLRDIFQQDRNRVIIFPDQQIRVAHLGLVRTVDSADLDKLIVCLCSGDFIDYRCVLKKDGLVTRMVAKGGVRVGRYEGRWVDDDKKEFVARIKWPKGETVCVAYRKLGEQGDFSCFGKVANVPQNRQIKLVKRSQVETKRRLGLVGVGI